MSDTLQTGTLLPFVVEDSRPPMGCFEHQFADLWSFAPLRLSSPVARFVERFTTDAVFDAELFWKYMAQWQRILQKKELHARQSDLPAAA